MQATSAAQFEAASGDGVPPLEEIRDGVFAIGLRQPGSLPHYTLCYLLLDARGAVHLIDCGWDTEENWAALGSSLESLGRSYSDVATVTVTHLHPDHLGLASRVRSASGASVALHRAEQAGIRSLATPKPAAEWAATLGEWAVPDDRIPELLAALERRGSWGDFTADRLLDDGAELPIPGRSLRVLHTPGHTTGHIAIASEDDEVLLLGDLLLPNQFPGIGLGGDHDGHPIDDYLESLRRVAELDAFEALPGHGFRFRGIAERCAVVAAHHENRSRQVAEVLDRERTVWAVAGNLDWTYGWENLRGLALLSALAQTELHINRVRGSGLAG